MRRLASHAGRLTPRALSAALVALVLLLQGLIPAAAIAHDHAGQIQICTAQGVRLITPQSGHGLDHHFGGLACEQCVMGSLAALAAAPPPEPVPTLWAYAAPRVATPAAAPLQARAPPRPPSQGPPVLA